MIRSAMEHLQKWNAKKRHKPLVIRGARQVGKTWLMEEFGRSEYRDVVYINFDNNERMKNLFEGDLSIERIATGLELYAGHKLNVENTLLIFDEVQEVSKALTSLRYFNEDAPQCQIVCAGSLLGIALHQGTSFPVGKVEFLDLYPLSLSEFMAAMGEVKTEPNLQTKSLKVYHEKFQPRLSIRTSMAEYKKEDWLLNLPLWAAETAHSNGENNG